MKFKQKLAWPIAIATLIRVAMAATAEFGNVEAYYWVRATRLQWNYFDHPPMVAYLTRLTTANLLWHHELFVRLGTIIAAGICSWPTFKITSRLAGESAGWFAAVLYSTFIYSGVNIAAFILPDSPQMVFWLASLYFLLRIVQIETTDAKFVA